MRKASRDYKEIMRRNIRNRAYISVGIGVINQEAQKSGKTTSETAYWANSAKIFDDNPLTGYGKQYATMEENYFKCDGSLSFLPETNFQEYANAAISNDILGAVKIGFNGTHSIKGLTIDFGEFYPTKFTVDTKEVHLEFENNLSKFETSEVLGDTDYIVITPIEMIGGQKRLRIYNILMGVGVVFTNENIRNANISEFVSTISEELPNSSFDLEIYDDKNRFDIDDPNSYIQFLEGMQSVTVSFGVELDSGEIEWIKYGTYLLSDWDKSDYLFTINTVDKISLMENEYSLGNMIYERTAYQEAESILIDAGLEPDQYIIDEYLKDILLANPMPVGSHKECLQVLANACRCILYQNSGGQVVIKANFANVVGPDDLVVESNDLAEWGHLENVLNGSDYVYADMTKDSFISDGSLYFVPENKKYLETGYVSDSISDENGFFNINPIIELYLPAKYDYYSLAINFDIKPPEEMVVHTYYGGEYISSFVFDNLEMSNVLSGEFLGFDHMVFEFAKAKPFSRVNVNLIALGEITEYILDGNSMMGKPHGFSEKKVKNVRVKVNTYVNDDSGNPVEVNDSVYVEKVINPEGVNKTCSNPLVSTTKHAEELLEWLSNYYSNTIEYDVPYRGEPRIQAADIIKMEHGTVNNLQVEVNGHTLQFNGSFSGTLQLRRAIRMV